MQNITSPRTDDAGLEPQLAAESVAPRVTLADLEANICDTAIVKYIAPSGQVLRWAVITARNGFAVTGKPSASVSPENDNAEIGERLAVENARNELWAHMGYALKQRLHDAAQSADFKERVRTEKADLDERLNKLLAFTSTLTFTDLPEAERQRLHAQAHYMQAYSNVLGERIVAWEPL